MAMLADDFVRVVATNKSQVLRHWMVANPLPPVLKERIKDAWRVLTGRYQAIKFAAIEYEKDKVYKRNFPLLTDAEVQRSLEKVEMTFANEVAEIRSDGKGFVGVGRNDLCPCNSGKKYKNCCLED